VIDALGALMPRGFLDNGDLDPINAPVAVKLVASASPSRYADTSIDSKR